MAFPRGWPQHTYDYPRLAVQTVLAAEKKAMFRCGMPGKLVSPGACLSWPMHRTAPDHAVAVAVETQEAATLCQTRSPTMQCRYSRLVTVNEGWEHHTWT